jgi:hypothetical protein
MTQSRVNLSYIDQRLSGYDPIGNIYSPVTSYQSSPYIPDGVQYAFVADLGSIALSGQAANVPIPRTFLASRGSLAVSGQPTALSAARSFIAAMGSQALAGQPSNISYQGDESTGYGSLILSGYAAALKSTSVFSLDTQSFNLSGYSINLTVFNQVDVGLLSLLGFMTDIHAYRLVNVATPEGRSSFAPPLGNTATVFSDRRESSAGIR